MEDKNENDVFTKIKEAIEFLEQNGIFDSHHIEYL